MSRFHFSDESLVRVLPDAVIVLDPQYVLCWWNVAAKKMLRLGKRYGADAVVKLLFDQPGFAEIIRDRKGQLDIASPFRSNRRLSVTVISYQGDHIVLVIRDVTHTYNLEKMRQDFVANLSHELRTPLTVVRGYLEILLEQMASDAAHYQMLEQMHEQSIRMAQLVEDLLLLSSLETDQPDRWQQQTVPVATLLERILKEAQLLSADCRHCFHLDVDCALSLQGDTNLLYSAFSNIIFNAVNYTPAHGEIFIRWFADQQGKHLTVRDTGIGIAGHHIPRLTERFYRVDKARSRGNGGTGLGLAIVKHVLLRHGGQLVITSTPQQGSTFDCIFRH